MYGNYNVYMHGPGQGTLTASKTTDGPRVSPLGDHTTRETSQTMERLLGPILERRDLAEDSARLANLETAIRMLRPHLSAGFIRTRRNIF